MIRFNKIGKFELSVTKTTIMVTEEGANLGLETGKYVFLKPLEEALNPDVARGEVH